MGKCKECGMGVDSCDNPECINNLHNSDSIKEGEEIFCVDGNHYCEDDCAADEWKKSKEWIISEVVKD